MYRRCFFSREVCAIGRDIREIFWLLPAKIWHQRQEEDRTAEEEAERSLAKLVARALLLDPFCRGLLKILGKRTLM